MSAYLPWNGPALTMEQELVRLALALKEVHASKKLTLDNYTPKTQEAYISVTQGTYDFAETPQKDHIIVVFTLPIASDAAQFARKPWLNVVQLGNESIPAAYGTP